MPGKQPFLRVRLAKLGEEKGKPSETVIIVSGEIYTAPSPEGVGEEKYDATATSMVGLLKYGVGTPFNRIEKLQDGLKIPLPAATQWDLVQGAAKTLAPAHEELMNRVLPVRVLDAGDPPRYLRP